MDLGSPSAFCALAMTVFASCAIAVPHRQATQVATSTRFFTTAAPPYVRTGHPPQPDKQRCTCPWSGDDTAGFLIDTTPLECCRAAHTGRVARPALRAFPFPRRARRPARR